MRIFFFFFFFNLPPSIELLAPSLPSCIHNQKRPHSHSTKQSLKTEQTFLFCSMSLGSREHEGKENLKRVRFSQSTYNILLERCVAISRCYHDICSNVVLLILPVTSEMLLVGLGLNWHSFGCGQPSIKEKNLVSSLCKVVWKPTISITFGLRETQEFMEERSKQRKSQ